MLSRYHIITSQYYHLHCKTGKIVPMVLKETNDHNHKKNYTLSQECPRNSFTEAEFCAYIKGETQKPHIHQLGIRSVSK